MSEPAPKRRRLRPALAEPDVEMEAEAAMDAAAEAAEAEVAAPAADAQMTAEPIGESASAPPVSAPPVSAPTAGEDSDSSDSDSESDTSSSSASSVSESSSEEEMDPALMEELPEDANKETEAAKKQRHLELARSAQLRRNDLMALLGDLPPEEAEKAIQNAFVVVKTDENQTALAEVVGVEPSAPYNCRHPEHPKEVKRLVVQLRCKRGVSEKFIKASAISSASIEESHIQQWSKVIARCRIDPELVLDRLKDRAEQISRNKHIDYTEDTVKDILAQKKKIEFDAQKQSRMACNVQIGLTQMDISSIKEFEMAQLAKDHKAAEEHLHKMEKKEYEAQEHWFETRRDLYGVKEINRMNVERQKRDDAHALKYALEHEEQEQTKINPFERRACRPVSAWDTSLTFVEELEEMKRQRLAREARAKQAQEAKAQAKVVKVAEEAGKVKEGMEKMEKMEKMTSSAEGNIGNIECLKGSKGKDGEEDELDELDKMINAAREQTEQNQRENGEDDDAEMASQLKASQGGVQLGSAGVRKLQTLESDSDDEAPPKVRELSAEERDQQEMNEQTMDMLKMYQELLRNAS